jgi:hypothetical protein
MSSDLIVIQLRSNKEITTYPDLYVILSSGHNGIARPHVADGGKTPQLLMIHVFADMLKRQSRPACERRSQLGGLVYVIFPQREVRLCYKILQWVRNHSFIWATIRYYVRCDTNMRRISGNVSYHIIQINNHYRTSYFSKLKLNRTPWL